MSEADPRMRWMTANELAIELGCDPRFVYTLYKLGQIQGVGTNRATMRYLDPGPELAKRVHLTALDTSAFITALELAEVAGVTNWAVLKAVHRGELTPTATDGRPYKPTFYFNRLAVREFLARSGKARGRQRFTYSPLLVKWLRTWLDSGEVQMQVIDQLVHEVAAKVPDPDKTRIIKAIWDRFDDINNLLRQCDRFSR